jgi:hypothetical protein
MIVTSNLRQLSFRIVFSSSLDSSDQNKLGMVPLNTVSFLFNHMVAQHKAEAPMRISFLDCQKKSC